MLLSLLSASLMYSKPLILLMSYVSVGNSFPKPLTEEEERECLERYENGDLEAKNTLIERNLRLVAHIVKKYGNTGKDPDDLISIGTIGLIKSINTYNKDKGTKLATYSARCIENEILMNIRAGKKIRTEVSMQEPIGIDKEGNEISFNDILGSDADTIIDDVNIRIQIKKLYDKMSLVLKSR
ncbi:MAG: RNA polymerase sporulation sigma factor SigK, partial [Peptostreptococcales bacterium]